MLMLIVILFFIATDGKLTTDTNCELYRYVSAFSRKHRAGFFGKTAADYTADLLKLTYAA